MSTQPLSMIIPKSRKKVRNPETLIERHRFTINYVASRMRQSWKLTHMDEEDLRSAGYLRLAKLIDEKDSRLDAKWFVDQCLRNAMHTALHTKILPHKTRFQDHYLWDVNDNNPDGDNWNHTSATSAFSNNDVFRHDPMDVAGLELSDHDGLAQDQIIDSADIQTFMTFLDHSEQDFLTCHFGLDGRDPQSIDQIATERGWGAYKTRTTFNRILLKIRTKAKLECKYSCVFVTGGTPELPLTCGKPANFEPSKDGLRLCNDHMKVWHRQFARKSTRKDLLDL